MIFNQKFESRAEINDLLGGDIVKGIVPAEKSDAILLFTNENEIYTDYFYPKGTYDSKHKIHSSMRHLQHKSECVRAFFRHNAISHCCVQE